MEKDTQQELERLEEALRIELEEAPLSEDELLESLDLASVFEDLAEPVQVEEAYANSPNDYSDALQEFADNGGEEKQRKYFGKKLTLGLMITAGVLCLGIVGLLIYWLNHYL